MKSKDNRNYDNNKKFSYKNTSYHCEEFFSPSSSSLESKKHDSDLCENNKKWEHSPVSIDMIYSIPFGKTQEGSFGSRKDTRYCSGVEITCKPEFDNIPVYSVEEGTVVAIMGYGNKDNEDRKIILIEGKSGVVCYCNIIENKEIKVGLNIKMGTCIGSIVPIYFKDRETGEKQKKNKIRIEHYVHGIKKRIPWNFTNNKKPNKILDPTNQLISVCLKNYK